MPCACESRDLLGEMLFCSTLSGILSLDPAKSGPHTLSVSHLKCCLFKLSVLVTMCECACMNLIYQSTPALSYATVNKSRNFILLFSKSVFFLQNHTHCILNTKSNLPGSFLFLFFSPYVTKFEQKFQSTDAYCLNMKQIKSDITVIDSCLCCFC